MLGNFVGEWTSPPVPPPSTLSRTFFSFLFFSSILAELRLASICARLFTASLTILVGLFLVAIPHHHQPRPNRTHFDGAGPSWVLQHFGLHTVVVHDTSRITAEMQFTLHRARDSDVYRIRPSILSVGKSHSHANFLCQLPLGTSALPVSLRLPPRPTNRPRLPKASRITTSAGLAISAEQNRLMRAGP